MDGKAVSRDVNRYRWIMVLLSVIFVLGSIGGYLYMNRETEAVHLKVGAGGYGTDSYEMMREIAAVVNRHSTGLVLDVIPTSDSSENISLLNAGKLDLATIRSDTPVVSDVRMIANLFPDYFQLITRADAGIFNVKDLVGKRIAIPPFGTDEFRSFWVVGDHYDLPISGVKWNAIPFRDGMNNLLKGSVDAIFTVRSLRDPSLVNLFQFAELKKLKLRYINIDQAQAISLKRPFMNVGVVPKGAFLGKGPTPSQDTTTAFVYRTLISHEGVDTDAIKELTRVMFEHRLDLTIRFPLASSILRPDIDAGMNVPLHDGSEQYFSRNEPSFLQENAEPIALMITVAAMLGSALLALRSRFMSSQKNRMDSYNNILLEIANRTRNTNSLAELKDLKQEMFTMLEEVVEALDTDEVTEDGFQSFSLLWEAVRDMQKDRSAEITAN